MSAPVITADHGDRVIAQCERRRYYLDEGTWRRANGERAGVVMTVALHMALLRSRGKA